LYENETDNYRQTHYQLFYNLAIDDNWGFNTAAFLTRGIGYYENYKSQQEFSDYGLPDFVVNDSTFETTDLVRRKWLDNYFYGQGVVHAISKKQTRYNVWRWLDEI
jgi:iron complex outermembrane receptor protein